MLLHYKGKALPRASRLNLLHLYLVPPGIAEIEKVFELLPHLQT